MLLRLEALLMVMLVGVFAPSLAFAETKREYDRFRNHTNVVVSAAGVSTSSADLAPPSLTIVVKHAGEQPTVPLAEAFLQLTFASEPPRFAKCSSLALAVDGVPLPTGPFEYASSSITPPTEGGARNQFFGKPLEMSMETFSAKVPIGLAWMLTTSTKVIEAKACDQVVTLPPGFAKELKAALEAASPPKAASQAAPPPPAPSPTEKELLQAKRIIDCNLQQVKKRAQRNEILNACGSVFVDGRVEAAGQTK